MTQHLDSAETERALREALSARARQIHPSSRLDAILREASRPEGGRGERRWPTVLAVAASAALVAGVVWAARPDTDDSTLPAGRPSATASTSDGPSASPPSPSPSASPTPRARPTAVLPVYRVGTNGGETNRPGLVREFWPAVLPGTAPTESLKVSAAVTESLRRSELWRGVSLVSADVTDDGITLRLTGTGDAVPEEESARLAVSSVVWTAQAAVGRGDLPVRIRAGDGGRLLGQLSTSTPFTRAGSPPDALCDIWVDNPAPGATVPAGEPVLVRGQGVAYEATLEWELRRGTAVVREGFTTADAGAPRRGTFTIDLGRLEAGTWTIRVLTTSAEDGQAVVAERLVTFTAR